MARVRSLPKVRGVGVEGVCIGEVAGTRAVGDYRFSAYFGGGSFAALGSFSPRFSF